MPCGSCRGRRVAVHYYSQDGGAARCVYVCTICDLRASAIPLSPVDDTILLKASAWHEYQQRRRAQLDDGTASL